MVDPGGRFRDNPGMDALFPFSATTDDCTVRVSVTYLADQSLPSQGRWFWAYHIRIENAGKAPVQLLSRRWTIKDGRGMQTEVEGDGVVGEQPIIEPGKSYDYVSGCPLATPTGQMSGHYVMIDDSGSPFEIAVPVFPLTASMAPNP